MSDAPENGQNAKVLDEKLLVEIEAQANTEEDPVAETISMKQSGTRKSSSVMPAPRGGDSSKQLGVWASRKDVIHAPTPDLSKTSSPLGIRRGSKAPDGPNGQPGGGKDVARNCLDQMAAMISSKNGMTNLNKIFNELDTDGNGSLDPIEFAVALKRFGAPNFSSADVLTIFEACDKDKNGTISADELAQVAKTELKLVFPSDVNLFITGTEPSLYSM
jgi:hypothetical protein